MQMQIRLETESGDRVEMIELADEPKRPDAVRWRGLVFILRHQDGAAWVYREGLLLEVPGR